MALQLNVLFGDLLLHNSWHNTTAWTFSVSIYVLIHNRCTLSGLSLTISRTAVNQVSPRWAFFKPWYKGNFQCCVLNEWCCRVCVCVLCKLDLHLWFLKQVEPRWQDCKWPRFDPEACQPPASQPRHERRIKRGKSLTCSALLLYHFSWPSWWESRWVMRLAICSAWESHPQATLKALTGHRNIYIRKMEVTQGLMCFAQLSWMMSACLITYEL